MAKNNKYITARLDWAEKQLAKWEKYIEDHPYDQVEDRIALKETKKGGVIPVPVATIEDQQKDQRATIKEYLEFLAAVKKLRKEDETIEDDANYAGIKESSRMLKARDNGE